MNDLRAIVSVIMQIMTKNFVVFGTRINLLAVAIGCGVITILLYFFYRVFGD